MMYVELNKIADIIPGYAIPSQNMTDEGTAIIKITNIREDGSLDLDNLVRYNKPITDKLKKFILREKDIVVCMTGATIGKVARILAIDQEYIVNQRVAIIRAKKEELQDFVFHVLTLPTFRRYVEIVGYGAAQPNISADAIGKYKYLDLCNVDIEKHIANILSSYDELLDKNNRKIAILQEMAEELYKEWFVRFRFPKYKSAKFKNSSLGRIPQDFEVVKMTNVFDDYIGGGWGNEEENKQYNMPAYVIRGTDFPYVTNGKLSTCPYRWHKESNLSLIHI